ncbi:hypothetical protein Hypma_000304 [Hypsizygus marmoreus]|uniref:RanBD1 domain-containing protein n=1 Tax=Hypsizygus marmoreus TaxID=39966 RepID=A0A369J8W5_HYPMA|nr:hypothetical protein Hypma_000304 [Hypsizygus marmoreus]
MYPVTDFNFAFGIATIAATVGYAFSRRLSSEPRTIARETADPPESAVVPQGKPQEATDKSAPPTAPNAFTGYIEQTAEAGSLDNMNATTTSNLTRQSSLKRKRAHDEQEDSNVDSGYPHNLTSIYPPKKRSRTPSSENGPETAKEEPDSHTNTIVNQEQDATPTSDQVPTSMPNERAPTPPASTLAISPPSTEDARTPSPVFGSSAAISSPVPKLPLPTIPRTVTSKAFSAFAGSTSAFASAASSPYSSLKSGKPAWTVVSEKVEASPNEVAVDSNARNTEGTRGEPAASSALISHVLAAAEVTPKSTVEHLTGEENEDVELELKGVRLLVKRGGKPFSDGMVGHVKLLSNKTNLDERLLFRREPLWQVSMNVRMLPTIRCTFDADEHVVRVILKEPIEKKDVPKEDWEREVVVYALKPSRSCSKQDFKDFANSLIESPGLKRR